MPAFIAPTKMMLPPAPKTVAIGNITVAGGLVGTVATPFVPNPKSVPPLAL
jgi:hypothetical protein